jgi:hypothetical protein
MEEEWESPYPHVLKDKRKMVCSVILNAEKTLMELDQSAGKTVLLDSLIQELTA